MHELPTNVVRWGVLGSAKISETGLGPAVTADPRNSLIAVGSRHIESAKRSAAALGAARAYGSYEELLADPEIDIVYNPLPNSLHHEWTIKALEAGKHVLCEKPMAMTAREVREMTETAARTNRLLLEGFMWRYHARVKRILQLVEEWIGPLRLVRIAYTYDLAAGYGGDAEAASRDIRLSANMGGGALGDIGSYTISGLRTYAGGTATSVVSQLLTERHGVDMRFSGEVLFDNGVVGQFFVAMDIPGGAVVDLVGDNGRLRMPNAFRTSEAWGDIAIELVDSAGTVSTEVVPYADQFELEVRSITGVLLDGESPVISARDSLDNATLMDGIRRSWTDGIVTL